MGQLVFPVSHLPGCVARGMISITAYVWYLMAKTLGYLCQSGRCYLHFSGMTTEV